jgi:hypothetical protein
VTTRCCAGAEVPLRDLDARLVAVGVGVCHSDATRGPVLNPTFRGRRGPGSTVSCDDRTGERKRRERQDGTERDSGCGVTSAVGAGSTAC